MYVVSVGVGLIGTNDTLWPFSCTIAETSFLHYCSKEKCTRSNSISNYHLNRCVWCNSSPNLLRILPTCNHPPEDGSISVIFISYFSVIFIHVTFISSGNFIQSRNLFPITCFLFNWLRNIVVLRVLPWYGVIHLTSSETNYFSNLVLLTNIILFSPYSFNLELLSTSSVLDRHCVWNWGVMNNINRSSAVLKLKSISVWY